eukprot:COSAG06_NODE_556_length_14336_cov_8.683290_15_plen_362_part_00
MPATRRGRPDRSTPGAALLPRPSWCQRCSHCLGSRPARPAARPAQPTASSSRRLRRHRRIVSPLPRPGPSEAWSTTAPGDGWASLTRRLQPPVGDLRWRKTVPKARLDKTLDTHSFGPACAQIGPAWASLGGLIKNCRDFAHGCPNMTWTNATSEDCLSLNVYSPDIDPLGGGDDVNSSLLPVVVYFPAGAFQWGASNDEENDGFHKSITPGWNRTVFVSANYRTGIFGFLASDSLRNRSGDNSSGLLGVHDQTTVLQWVKANIAAFGGDPQRVMIFGESAGATSMSLHLVMPESAGLYHAVAIDSGAFNQWAYRSWEDAVEIYENITRALVRNTLPVLCRFILKRMFILPRQARDKHRNS